MKRVALIVQRCHARALGGSEALALHYAQQLQAHYEVEILTSCAVDYVSWDNVLPAGEDCVDGVRVRRFASAFPRGRAFGELHRRLLADHARDGALPRWTEAQAEAFIRFQGPWCPDLVAHLAAHADAYAAVIGCTYLYPTTYFGLDAVPHARRILVPTLHDEPPAYLPAFAALARRCAQRLWLTEAERALAGRLWDLTDGEVVGMAVEALPEVVPERRARPYLLYCGRLDESKGVVALLRAFDALRAQGVQAELVLTGIDLIGLPRREDVVFLGDVDAARRAALMAGCAAFVMPSAHESFSIVTLQAMAQGAPVLVNGASEVLAEHVARSGNGLAYTVDAAAQQGLRALLALDEEERLRQARRGRDYVATHYAPSAVAQRLHAAVAAVAGA